jgi:hypothetical protein
MLMAYLSICLSRASESIKGLNPIKEMAEIREWLCQFGRPSFFFFLFPFFFLAPDLFKCLLCTLPNSLMIRLSHLSLSTIPHILQIVYIHVPSQETWKWLWLYISSSFQSCTTLENKFFCFDFLGGPSIPSSIESPTK